MNICGENLIVDLQIRNLDCVDVAATSMSCDNLTVNGNPISNVFQNVSAAPGSTSFTGSVIAQSLQSTGTLISPTATFSGDVSTGNLTSSSINSTGNITGTLATATQNNVTKVGTQTSLTVSGTSTLASVTASGSITQSAGTTTLKATTVDSLTSAGNITQSAGTATLKDTVVDVIRGPSTKSCIYSIARYELGADTTNASTGWWTLVWGISGSFNYGNASSYIGYNSSTGVFTNNTGKTCLFRVTYNVQVAASTFGSGNRYARIQQNPSLFCGETRTGVASGTYIATYLNCTEAFTRLASETFLLEVNLGASPITVGASSYVMVECMG